MKNNPILITGCQRSGTTLLHLIVDSHPEINGVDEKQFELKRMDEYLNHAAFSPFVSFKLPVYAPVIRFIKDLQDITVLWCIRDPRDVVASMINLHLRYNHTVSVSWAVHPYGVKREIENCFPVLGDDVKQQLSHYMEKYDIISKIPPPARNIEDVVFTGALCWRVKNELLGVYEKENIEYMKVFYERLINDPEKEVRDILEFIDLPWHDNVLKHHLLHTGIEIGNTDSTRAIDQKNTGKWKKIITQEGLSIINELCPYDNIK